MAQDKSPKLPRKAPPSPEPAAPSGRLPGGPDSGTTQEMSRAEILEYLEKMKKKDGGAS